MENNSSNSANHTTQKSGTGQLKVLVVDDSLIFRHAVEGIVKTVAGTVVVGSVRNGVKAMEFIRNNPPDLVTLDVEMPEMDGLETLKEIQKLNQSGDPAYNIGVIMVSALTQKGAEITIEALENGAFDFVAKPIGADPEENQRKLKFAITGKIRTFRVQSRRIKRSPVSHTTQVASDKGTKPAALTTPSPRKARTALAANMEAIFIGVSTGGPKALAVMLPVLSSRTDLPIFIVQHMPPKFTKSLADSLNKKCQHTVVEATAGMIAEDNHVYIAPGGNHLFLKREVNGKIVTALNTESPENGSRPSVDVLFRSAAKVYGKSAIAVIMTGMGSDGAKGLILMKEAGAYVVAQDEDSSVVWGMPGSAVAIGVVDEVVPLEEIPEVITFSIK